MPVPTVLIPDDDAIARMHANGEQPLTTPMREVRLGRVRPKARPMAPRLAGYHTTAGATPPPPIVDWFSKALSSLKRMYLNDTYGDCVIAGKMHQLGVFSGNDSDAIVLATDQEVSDQYFGICGPGNNGCVITDVLDVWKARGLSAGGRVYKIDGYVSVDWTNKLEVQVAIYLFGSLTIGINLPSAWTSGGDGSFWDVTNSGIVGGHDVCCVGYNSTGVQIATWGGLRTITWAAFTSTRWIEECYAQLAPLWYGSDKLAPSGIDAAKLKADLDLLGSGTIPPIDPSPSPVPPVPPPTPVVITSMGKTQPKAIAVPTGPFGRTIAVTIPALDVSVTGTLPGPSVIPAGLLEMLLDEALANDRVQCAMRKQFAEASAAPPGLLIKIIAAIVPVVIADLAAGKTIQQMIPDLIAAILAALATS